MRGFLLRTTVCLLSLMCCAFMAIAEPNANIDRGLSQIEVDKPFVLGPPEGAPTVVDISFELLDINAISDAEETFEFTGVLTLKWRDPRQAFDPMVTGVDEKIFTGNFQVDEISPAWYPQIILVNQSDGSYQQNAVVLRQLPDGTSTLIQSVTAVAKTNLNMRQFPIDKHRLEAVFSVLGFDRGEVLLQLDSATPSSKAAEFLVSQWNIANISATVGEQSASYSGKQGAGSSFVLAVDVQRNPWFTMRLVVIPLVVVVLLSFVVFWMERSSIGDRLSISFIGILTAVVYQQVMSEYLPRTSEVTLIHGFLNISFLTMCATVVMNLVVVGKDRAGKLVQGDRIDYHCRWIFPLVYFSILLVIFGVAMRFL